MTPSADIRGRRGTAYWPTTRLEYTGPIFAELERPIPPAIEAALGRKGPIVYVATTSAPEDLVRKVVGEVASTGMELVVAGTVHDLSDLARPNVTVGGILPSHKIMPRVDLAVTAGGQGSMQCAMAAGTPVIGIPLQPEQDANVHLLELKGSARLLPERDVGRGMSPALVSEVTTRQSYKTSARAIQSAYSGRNGRRSPPRRSSDIWPPFSSRPIARARGLEPDADLLPHCAFRKSRRLSS